MKLGDHIINAFRQIDRAVRVRGLGHTLTLSLRVLAQEGPAGIKRRLDALGPALRTGRPSEPGSVLILTPPIPCISRAGCKPCWPRPASRPSCPTMTARREISIRFSPLRRTTFRPSHDRCIAFQVEQSIMPDRWTPEYLENLGKCRAVLEYSQTNIAALQGQISTSKIFYVPLTPAVGAPIDKPATPRCCFTAMPRPNAARACWIRSAKPCRN